MNSREKLEFRELLGQLGRFVISTAGRERLSYLGPKNSILEIERALVRVREMASLLDKGVFFDFSGIPDLSSVIAKARTGAFLTPSELYSLSLFIEKVHEVFQKLMGTALEEVLADPYLLLGLMREIRSKIDEEGEVVDTASEALYKIRSERRKKRREIIALMEGLLDRYDRKGLLRDRVVTIKNGRMVLPFKSHVRVKGVVHGFSNTEETVYIEPFEVIEAQNRLVRVEEEELAVDVIKDVGPGGHFLAHGHTLRHLRELYYFDIFTKESLEIWKRKGSKDIAVVAKEKAKKLLEEHQPEPLDSSVREEVDGIIRRAEKELIG